MCSRYLASAKRQGDCIVLDLSLQEANDLAGWVAAEANHAEIKSDKMIPLKLNKHMTACYSRNCRYI